MRGTILRLAGALTCAILPGSAHAALSASIVDWGEVRAEVRACSTRTATTIR
jgi:hypothetical protein